MSVEINIAYEGSLHCTMTHAPSGSVISTDAPVDNGGKGEAFSPTDLVAAALGGCMLTIMGLAAAKHHFDITGTTAKVVKDMVSAPRRIGHVTVEITLPESVRAQEEALALLEEAANHCPVKQSLHPDIAITTTFSFK